MNQNIWEQKVGLHRQKRRAQLVSSYLKGYSGKTILDIGCAEGYATSFMSKSGITVVGVEINIEYLKVASKKLSDVEFVNASFVNLPFRDGTFDGVCILEVLEHLTRKMQERGIEQIDRLLRPEGSLIISIPYKENIIQTNCIHCGKITPLYGHLKSLDESDIAEILPNNQYRLIRTCRLPNIPAVSCKNVFEVLPLRMWLILNNFLGIVGRGYWIVLQYMKGGSSP